MVIGETFAIGHVPKTGGDAVHIWFSQFAGVQVDPIGEARKHDFFWQRNIEKELYVLSIRRLPSWALSYLHELVHHPKAAAYYDIPASNPVRPEHAFLLRPDDYLLQHQKGNRKIGVWLRMECLFEDVLQFIQDHIQPVTPLLRGKLAAAPTKGKRGYNHDFKTFFTASQIATLYARNPIWTAVEAKVYGALDGAASTPSVPVARLPHVA